MIRIYQKGGKLYVNESDVSNLCVIKEPWVYFNIAVHDKTLDKWAAYYPITTFRNALRPRIEDFRVPKWKRERMEALEKYLINFVANIEKNTKYTCINE